MRSALMREYRLCMKTQEGHLNSTWGNMVFGGNGIYAET